MKMFRSYAWAALACLAIASTVAWAIRPAFDVVTATYRKVKKWVLDGFKLAAGGEGESQAQPAILLVQAKAFVLRLAKRERPELTGSWRMCPST